MEANGQDMETYYEEHRRKTTISDGIRRAFAQGVSDHQHHNITNLLVWTFVSTIASTLSVPISASSDAVFFPTIL